MNPFSKKPKALSSVRCTHCQNDNLLIFLDFKNKKTTDRHLAFCIKTVTRNAFGIEKIKGCGKVIKIGFLPTKEKSLLSKL